VGQSQRSPTIGQAAEWWDCAALVYTRSDNVIADRIDELRKQYTGKYVLVDASRPELARWAGVLGEVKTINQNGRALVQFDGADRGWHDIDPRHLGITEPPPQPAE
jgi:hypothetical protein